ncbi:MAG: 16S rRNA (uracil(1498)-N(3))-methyltransferase [Alphaproteobacteria bacterium]|nr:16S rRNA (uracil(1498)-N(3))-methyltransferase [Alphaproteobacteria bacterium]
MKNIPRIFIDAPINIGGQISVGRDVSHYLSRVMRTDKCLVFGDGNEYLAELSPDARFLTVCEQTSHIDPSNKLTLIFSPIKRTDDLLNMATQMGVGFFQPVVMSRTVAHHINWERMRKIVIEASEQSNRNSIPVILPVKTFQELDLSKIVFADERAAYGRKTSDEIADADSVMIGPEGGFSDSEFDALDSAGARSLSLGKTILRAEVASIVAISKVLK